MKLQETNELIKEMVQLEYDVANKYLKEEHKIWIRERLVILYNLIYDI